MVILKEWPWPEPAKVALAKKASEEWKPKQKHSFCVVVSGDSNQKATTN